MPTKNIHNCNLVQQQAGELSLSLSGCLSLCVGTGVCVVWSMFYMCVSVVLMCVCVILKGNVLEIAAQDY